MPQSQKGCKEGRERETWEAKRNSFENKVSREVKEYKNKCKSKRYIFWQNTIGEVEKSLNDPNTFWKKWKCANEIEKSTSTPNIHGEKWYEFFKGLHSEHDVNGKTNLEDGNWSSKTMPEKEENNKLFTRKEFDNI